MKIISYDYAWRLADLEAGKSGDGKFCVQTLQGREEIERVLEIEISRRHKFLTLSAIPCFIDFVARLSRLSRNDADSEPTVWTVDHYASYRILDTTTTSLVIPKHELRDDWNPTFIYQVWKSPSMRLWDAKDARDFDEAIRTHFAKGCLPIWDDCKSALVIWKKGHRYNGFHCNRL